MIFKDLLPLLKDTKISMEQLFLLSMLNLTEDSEVSLYLETFPEEKRKSIQNLLRRGFLEEGEDKELVVTEEGERLLDKADSLLTKNPIEEVEQAEAIEYWIDDFRKLFYGYKVGAMGSKSSCLKKMKVFLKKNPNVTKEDVINATRAYIDSLNGDYRFLQQADYFITKHDGSRLETWIEELKANPKPLGDWTSKLV